MDNLKRAIEGHHAIHFHYTRADGTQTERKVLPYRITANSYGAIYVHGYCALRHSKRTFRLDKMEEVEVGDAVVPDSIYLRACPSLLDPSNQTGTILSHVMIAGKLDGAE